MSVWPGAWLEIRQPASLRQGRTADRFPGGLRRDAQRQGGVAQPAQLQVQQQPTGNGAGHEPEQAGHGDDDGITHGTHENRGGRQSRAQHAEKRAEAHGREVSHPIATVQLQHGVAHDSSIHEAAALSPRHRSRLYILLRAAWAIAAGGSTGWRGRRATAQATSVNVQWFGIIPRRTLQWRLRWLIASFARVIPA